ncbi:hypothetical protein Q9966_016049 [Columba livia]|nr:hypothetical protein Q9966_016049 [Columba livia]
MSVCPRPVSVRPRSRVCVSVPCPCVQMTVTYSSRVSQVPCPCVRPVSVCRVPGAVSVCRVPGAVSACPSRVRVSVGMTVTYSSRVATARFGGFSRLLLLWRGSIYKLLYRELLLFLAAYGALSAAYRWVLSEPQRRLFEKLVLYCDKSADLIPVSFVLGFYVAVVLERWWGQFRAVPAPDGLAVAVAGSLRGGRRAGAAAAPDAAALGGAGGAAGAARGQPGRPETLPHHGAPGGGRVPDAARAAPPRAPALAPQPVLGALRLVLGAGGARAGGRGGCATGPPCRPSWRS